MVHHHSCVNESELIFVNSDLRHVACIVFRLPAAFGKSVNGQVQVKLGNSIDLDWVEMTMCHNFGSPRAVIDIYVVVLSLLS